MHDALKLLDTENLSGFSLGAQNRKKHILC